MNGNGLRKLPIGVQGFQSLRDAFNALFASIPYTTKEVPPGGSSGRQPY